MCCSSCSFGFMFVVGEVDAESSCPRWIRQSLSSVNRNNRIVCLSKIFHSHVDLHCLVPGFELMPSSCVVYLSSICPTHYAQMCLLVSNQHIQLQRNNTTNKTVVFVRVFEMYRTELSDSDKNSQEHTAILTPSWILKSGLQH